MCYQPVKMINSFAKKHCLRLFVVMFVDDFHSVDCIHYEYIVVFTWLLPLSYELHSLMYPYYNVWPGVICCCLQLIMLFTIKFMCSPWSLSSYAL